MKYSIKHAKDIIFREKRSHNFREFIRVHSLLMGIVFVVGIALTVTIVNMTLYTVTGTSKLDLSRPGYESARKEVNDEDKLNSSRGIPPTGKLTRDDIESYMVDFRKQQQTLRKYDTFDSKVLDNAQLNLPVEIEQDETRLNSQ